MLFWNVNCLEILVFLLFSTVYEYDTKRVFIKLQWNNQYFLNFPVPTTIIDIHYDARVSKMSFDLKIIGKQIGTRAS